MKKFLLLAALFLLVGCGYKPSSYYTKRVLGDKIYSKVYIDIKDPENSVLIKDAINEAIITKLGSKISDNLADADSSLLVKFKSKEFIPIAYDKDGYVVSYKSKVVLNITFKDRFGKDDSMDVMGTYDFPIEANSVISDTKRFEAIKFASYKAISEFISKISVKGLMGGKENVNKDK